MEDNIAIKLSGISKKYILHSQKPTLVERFLRWKKEELWALKDINLEIKKGSKIGIIGNNGAGKTTLLKIISGITAPTTGKVKVNGRLASLIDVRAGFHPDLSGKDNVFVNALLLGMSRQEIKKRFNRIVEFSGIKRFINYPLHTYSEGMALRLGFSIAVNSNPDILLVDGIISVGDKDFQKKSEKHFQKLYSQRKTVIIVSHDLEFLKKFSQRVIWIEKGKIKKDGEVNKVLNKYERGL